MDISYIVVQTGGLGKRLGKLTHNKPKSLVPINNRPILFHLFERYPAAEFIIIGDYKYAVLEHYLGTFAKVNYKLVCATEKGNAAGINAALGHIPAGAPFLLIWSDILLSNALDFQDLPDGNYVGLTTQYPCSWNMDRGVLTKSLGGSRGVAGLFLFSSKAVLSELPNAGSFVEWLSKSDVAIEPLDVLDSHDVGNPEAIKKVDSGENRCRPYNLIEFGETWVKKTTLTSEGKSLLAREIVWYKALKEYGFPHTPEIYSFEPLVMSRIMGSNIFSAPLNGEEKRRTIKRLVEALDLLHSYGECAADEMSLHMEYYEKTLKRLDSVKQAIPFSDKAYITINGKLCRNVLFFRKEFRMLVENRLSSADFKPIHGDATLTNTMIDHAGNIFYIDARGYFGNNQVYGDVYYDWAKLYYSISGNFDSFNIKNFDLDIRESEVRYLIHSSGWEEFTDYFLSLIPNCNAEKIKLIHAVIWLSLASHCWEDFDSLCTAFYVGTQLLEECWNDAH